MIVVAGTRRFAFTVGISLCEERKAHLPFFAFAPSAPVEADLGLRDASETLNGAEDVRRVVDAFDRHGVVIFLDNPVAVDRFIEMIDATLDLAETTQWYNRTPDPVRAN